MRPPNSQRYGDATLGYGELDERKWNRHVAAYYVAHPDKQPPSLLEAVERHRREAETEQAAMERGECCGQCSASGLCGSSRWGYLYWRYGSGKCPDHQFELGIQNWLKAILGDEYEQYCGNRPKEENGNDGGDHRGQAEASRGTL